ncbi:hypothetical protein [Deinococcus yunweiensis]|uniref:hypothetical protein n=1 Tax=Deinococcus yunweiensis TaxID=367282 RepID=UPI00398E388C
MDARFDWTRIDPLIVEEQYISALQAYRTATGTTLSEAMDAVGERGTYLRSTSPERFPVRIAPLAAARLALDGIERPIRVIEAVWDGDTVHDWFVVLVAVTDGPSSAHPAFTETYLCSITQRDVTGGSVYEFSKQMQQELAEQVGASTKAPVWPPDDEAPRWWDMTTDQI